MHADTEIGGQPETDRAHTHQYFPDNAIVNIITIRGPLFECPTMGIHPSNRYPITTPLPIAANLNAISKLLSEITIGQLGISNDWTNPTLDITHRAL